MPNKAVAFSGKNHIAEIVLKKSVIDQDAAQDLAEICRQIREDDDIYVVILAGSGKVFCQGGENIGEDLSSRCRHHRHRTAGYRCD